MMFPSMIVAWKQKLYIYYIYTLYIYTIYILYIYTISIYYIYILYIYIYYVNPRKMNSQQVRAISRLSGASEDFNFNRKMSSKLYPLVNYYITNWKDPPFSMGKSTINDHFHFRHFHNLPEGNSKKNIFKSTINGHLQSWLTIVDLNW